VGGWIRSDVVWQFCQVKAYRYNSECSSEVLCASVLVKYFVRVI
jgi:hypothetical protein